MVLRYGGVWCFLLADLIVGVQTAVRAPFFLSVSGTHGGVGGISGTKTKVSLLRESQLRAKHALANRQEHLAPTVDRSKTSVPP